MNVSISKDTVEKFFLYWTEPNRSKTNPKMKFELQKTWSVERRLRTWIDNDINKFVKK